MNFHVLKERVSINPKAGRTWVRSRARSRDVEWAGAGSPGSRLKGETGRNGPGERRDLTCPGRALHLPLPLTPIAPEDWHARAWFTAEEIKSRGGRTLRRLRGR